MKRFSDQFKDARFSLWGPSDQQDAENRGGVGTGLWGGFSSFQNSSNPSYDNESDGNYDVVGTLPRFQPQLETVYETGRESTRYDSMRTDGLGRGSMAQPLRGAWGGNWTKSTSTPGKPLQKSTQLPLPIAEDPSINDQAGIREQSKSTNRILTNASATSNKTPGPHEIIGKNENERSSSRTQSLRMWIGQMTAPLPSFYPKQKQFNQFRQNHHQRDVESAASIPSSQKQLSTPITETPAIPPRSFTPFQNRFSSPRNQSYNDQQSSFQASPMGYDPGLKPAGAADVNRKTGWNWRFIAIVFIFLMMIVGGVGAAVGTLANVQGAAVTDLTAAPTVTADPATLTSAPSFAPSTSPTRLEIINPLATPSPTIKKGKDSDLLGLGR
jgi:hypothetical protein